MAIDMNWASTGGIIMSPSGDIALSPPTKGTQQIIYSRLKAALNGWKQYIIGANLQAFHGTVVDEDLENDIQQSVANALSTQFLPSGSFEVTTLAAGGSVTIYVFINSTLAAQAVLSSDGTISVQQVA